MGIALVTGTKPQYITNFAFTNTNNDTQTVKETAYRKNKKNRVTIGENVGRHTEEIIVL
jgi:hypothetical protein